MPIYETPYYGTRRKALTGQGYGPYYGMSFTGGGALPAEGGRALPAEISQKYEATGTPAITGIGEDRGGGEGAPQPAFTGVAFADDPNANWGQLAYHAGLPFGTAYPGHPQPTGLAKTALGVAPTVASQLTGIPSIAFSQVVRNFMNPLLATAFPSLFSTGYTAETMMGYTLSSAQVTGTEVVGPEGATFGVGALGNVGLTGIAEGDLGTSGFASGEGYGGFGEGGGEAGFGGWD